jgi:hypothetical protein
MTFASKALATFLIAAASMTGLSACGDSTTTISSKDFLSRCKKTVDKKGNATIKGYDTDICKCVQQKLEDQGLGNKDADAKAQAPKETSATVACVQEVTQ